MVLSCFYLARIFLTIKVSVIAKSRSSKAIAAELLIKVLEMHQAANQQYIA